MGGKPVTGRVLTSAFTVSVKENLIIPVNAIWDGTEMIVRRIVVVTTIQLVRKVKAFVRNA